MKNVLFIVFLAIVLVACQTAPTATPTTNPTQIPPLTETPLPIPTFTQNPALTPTPMISPEILKAEASPICENAFSALVESGPLTPPFAVMKKITYADVPAWEFSGQLPHISSFSASDVRTVFCISETHIQAGTNTDSSPAYQIFWDVRAVSFPDGKVIGRNSLTGASPSQTKVPGSGADEGATPYQKFAAWVFDRVDHPNFIYFNDAITTITTSPDEDIAAFGSSIANQIVDKDFHAKIFLFDPSDMQITSSFEGHQGNVTSLAFSPDGKTLASSGFDSFIKFWDVVNHVLIGQVTTAGTPNAVAFSPDGNKLAVATNLEVIFTDTRSMQIGQPVQEAGGDSIAFSSDGSRVYVRSIGRIKLIDPNASIVTLSFPDPLKLIPTISTAADGSIVSVTFESPDFVEGFALSPDEAQLVTYTMNRSLDGTLGTENVRLATWDSQTGKYLSEIKFSGDLIQAIKLSPDGSLLAIGNRDEVWLWDTTNWQLRKILAGHVGYIVDLAFTPDGTNILSAGSDGTIRLWSLAE